jgi:hypothetical protein
MYKGQAAHIMLKAQHSTKMEFIFICVVILTCIPNIVCSFKHVSARNIDMINLCYVGIKFVSLQPTRYVRRS